jgi:nicotinamidase-related amidase
MLIDATQSALLVVDVQGRLVPAISGWQALLDQVVWLIRVARRMEIPVLACEQYPQGLGPTHPADRRRTATGLRRRQAAFSAVAGGCHGFSAAGSHPQLVVCGMETHVCVLQTVMELLETGRQVFVVEEAVGSRRDPTRRWPWPACARPAQRSSAARWWLSSGCARRIPTCSAKSAATSCAEFRVRQLDRGGELRYY